MEVGDTQELLLDRRVRGGDEVVLVLAPLALAFGGEDAEHAEGKVLDADHLAHRIGVREEGLGHRRAQQADLLRGEHIPRREVGPVAQHPVAHADVFFVAALDRRVPVLVARHHLGTAAHDRRPLAHGGKLRDGLRVLHGQARGGSRPAAYAAAAAVPAPRRNVNEGRTLALDLLVDRGPRAAAKGDHGDDRGHADDHPEHGEDRPHLVPPHGLEGDAKGIPNGHAMPPPSPRGEGPGALPPRDAAFRRRGPK